MAIKKITIMALIFLYIFTVGISCTEKQEPKIEFYRYYNENTNEISGKVDYIRTGVASYILFRYGKPFNEDMIGMHIDIPGITDDSIYEWSVKIDPKRDSVVFPVTIIKPAKYEIFVYFDTIDNPVFKGEFFALDKDYR